MRLVVLLVVLGGVLVAAAGLWGAGGSVSLQSEPAPQARVAPDEPSAGRTRPLPDAVRRLAEAPPIGPNRPVIVGEAQPVPVVVPVAPVNTIAADSGLRLVSARRANLREGPSTDYPIVASAERGDVLQVIGAEGGWLQVVPVDGGLDGWIADRLTESMD